MSKPIKKPWKSLTGVERARILAVQIARDSSPEMRHVYGAITEYRHAQQEKAELRERFRAFRMETKP